MDACKTRQRILDEEQVVEVGNSMGMTRERGVVRWKENQLFERCRNFLMLDISSRCRKIPFSASSTDNRNSFESSNGSNRASNLHRQASNLILSFPKTSFIENTLSIPISIGCEYEDLHVVGLMDVLPFQSNQSLATEAKSLGRTYHSVSFTNLFLNSFKDDIKRLDTCLLSLFCHKYRYERKNLNFISVPLVDQSRVEFVDCMGETHDSVQNLVCDWWLGGPLLQHPSIIFRLPLELIVARYKFSLVECGLVESEFGRKEFGRYGFGWKEFGRKRFGKSGFPAHKIFLSYHLDNHL
ncbi:uncharacterized protein BDR25DRAFT_352080 [Lindgomyces ingoldianus]|uniref:Uncharacterized protein n=1 Tax=Lindgomyces ingoldianus TaxID=673940 RepID=A0ACB6R429_9PLEO|nr:uncharacterized protein BDR25DRAFT_352080 [Lindgomyces ingoldianus]KAF2473588.1 hypothetical protein BDR25DRAFT_352080 [Lindgomyces ingoldianus]